MTLFIRKIIYALFFVPVFGNAQLLQIIEEREKCTLNAHEEDRFEELLAQNTTVKADLVSFGDIAEITNRDQIFFQNPYTGECLQAKVDKFEYINENEYAWAGRTQSGDGYVVLIKKEGLPPILQVFPSPPPAQA